MKLELRFFIIILVLCGAHVQSVCGIDKSIADDLPFTTKLKEFCKKYKQFILTTVGTLGVAVVVTEHFVRGPESITSWLTIKNFLDIILCRSKSLKSVSMPLTADNEHEREAQLQHPDGRPKNIPMGVGHSRTKSMIGCDHRLSATKHKRCRSDTSSRRRPVLSDTNSVDGSLLADPEQNLPKIGPNDDNDVDCDGYDDRQDEDAGNNEDGINGERVSMTPEPEPLVEPETQIRSDKLAVKHRRTKSGMNDNHQSTRHNRAKSQPNQGQEQVTWVQEALANNAKARQQLDVLFTKRAAFFDRGSFEYNECVEWYYKSLCTLRARRELFVMCSEQFLSKEDGMAFVKQHQESYLKSLEANDRAIQNDRMIQENLDDSQST